MSALYYYFWPVPLLNVAAKIFINMCLDFSLVLNHSGKYLSYHSCNFPSASISNLFEGIWLYHPLSYYRWHPISALENQVLEIYPCQINKAVTSYNILINCLTKLFDLLHFDEIKIVSSPFDQSGFIWFCRLSQLMEGITIDFIYSYYIWINI